jgi:thiol-disulfide isomerase/thioredoxin
MISAAVLALVLTNAKADQHLNDSADSTYTLTGAIEGLKNDWVYLRHGQTEKIDSVRAAAGRFIFTGEIDSPELCRLAITGPSGSKEFRIAFFLEKGVLQVKAKKEAMANAIISGTPVQDEFRQYQEKEKAAGPWPKPRQFAIEYIRSHPASYASVIALDSYFTYDPEDLGKLDTLFHSLDPAIRNSFNGRLVKATLDAETLTSVGRAAPFFEQPDVNGHTVSLSSFRGKYLLIDFWASWCAPCRAENPNVLKAYKAWHDKGLFILAVSLDEKKNDWLEAVKKDGLPWTQVSDLKGWKNSAAIEYGVNGIPMNFLLDREGIIVARGLRGEQLEKKLSELLH